MPTKMVPNLQHDPVIQFSVFVVNKCGKLLDIIKLLESHNTHVMALMILDTCDSSITRMIVDDPDRARQLFLENAIAFTESPVLAVEISSNSDLQKILSSLLVIETNIQYTYSFLTRPQGSSTMALHVDDPELATTTLSQHGFKVLHQKDISR